MHCAHRFRLCLQSLETMLSRKVLKRYTNVSYPVTFLQTPTCSDKLIRSLPLSPGRATASLLTVYI